MTDADLRDLALTIAFSLAEDFENPRTTHRRGDEIADTMRRWIADRGFVLDRAPSLAQIHRERRERGEITTPPPAPTPVPPEQPR